MAKIFLVSLMMLFLAGCSASTQREKEEAQDIQDRVYYKIRAEFLDMPSPTPKKHRFIPSMSEKSRYRT